MLVAEKPKKPEKPVLKVLVRSMRRLIPMLLASMMLCLPVAAQVGDASRLYVAGRRAVLDGRWNEAVLYLSAAIERRPREGGEVVVYGKHLEPYLPHFLLGVAFFELGALDVASKAWRESESQGRQSEVRDGRHKTLADLLRRYGSSLASAQALREADEALGALRDRLAGAPPEGLAASRQAFEHEVSAAVVEIERLHGEMARQPGAEGGAALRLLDRVDALVERGEQLLRAEHDARRQRLMASIRSARCDATAIDDVLEQLSGSADEAAGAFAATLAQELIDRCGLSHELMLAAARHPSLFDALGRAFEPGPGAFSGVSSGASSGASSAISSAISKPRDSTVREGLALLERTPCDRRGMARLARWLGERALERVEARHVSAPLASAFEACGDPGIAAVYGAGDGIVPEGAAPSPAAVSDARAVAVEAGRASTVPALAEAWAEATLRIDAGVCDPDWRRRLADDSRAAELARQAAELSGVPWAPELYDAKSARNCGRPERVADYLAAASIDEARPAGRRAEILQSLADWYRDQAVADFYAGRHALIFAAADYDDGARGWPDLPGARGDAEAVRDALLAYGFEEPRLVRDPSGRTVRREMKRFIEKYSGDDGADRLLLVYWAGHGAVLEGAYGGETWSTGFLVPVDAPYPHASLDPDSSFAKRAVSMDSLDEWAREMPSRHAIFMLDSCYSGSAFRTFGSVERASERRRLRPWAGAGEQTWDPLARYRQPVRLVVASSAADQRAADRSQFRRSFVEWLERPSLADFLRDQVVSGSELCLHLAESTREASGGRQSPSCQCLSSPWDQGDVIFPARLDSERGTVVSRWMQLYLLADLATWQSVRERQAPEAWAEYLRHYPRGRFAELARHLIATGGES